MLTLHTLHGRAAAICFIAKFNYKYTIVLYVLCRQSLVFVGASKLLKQYLDLKQDQ